MEDKLVTLAIRTYQRAQMIKSVLEQSGIETQIHNLNLEHPEMAVGVRVRIKESDLPRALVIVEEKEKAWELEESKDAPPRGRKILIPIDLTDQINEVCLCGFQFAERLHAEVIFLYAYFTPAFTITSKSDINTYSLADSEMLRRIVSTNIADVENLTNLISKWIAAGKIPDIKFRFELKEGVPEDQILEMCKKEQPVMVVMGSRGKNRKDEEVIGSVTAEVMESCNVPVFSVPVDIPVKSPADISRIAFLTNFDQKDLIAIDTAISFFNRDKLELIFIHASQKKDSWDEVMLVGIKEYFGKHYEGIKTEYAILNRDENLDQIQQFLAEANIDLVALNTKKRNIFARFFNQGIATKLLFNVDRPLLVMHL